MKQYCCIQNYHTRTVNSLGLIIRSPFPLITKGDILTENLDDGMFQSAQEIYKNVPESVLIENPDCFMLMPSPPTQKELELQEFLKYIMDEHTDTYGHLQVCTTGDELDPTIERVVKDYLSKHQKHE